jgi:uncharacterized protein YjdB
MGTRLRLKASFDISGFSAVNQVILTALKQYGMILGDNGASWFLTGAPDPAWDNSDLHMLTTITGSNFEAVDATVLMINPDSGQAAQTTVSVSVSPASASVYVNATKQFTATVTGASIPAVTWDVNGLVGGNSATGFIDSVSGLYRAPSVVPSPATVTVRASSNAVSPPAVGIASVTIVNSPAITIAISPATASVRLGHTRQFTAIVTNTSNQAVTWKVNGISGGNSTVGTVTGGLYVAPNRLPNPSSVTVTATSAADTTKAARAAVIITRR